MTSYPRRLAENGLKVIVLAKVICMPDKQHVSIIIPCRNEEEFIGKCLDSIITNDYPKDLLEVLVVDGISDDGTTAVVREYIQRYPFIRLLHNPEKVTPVALNVGIEGSRGEIIMRMDAHVTYETSYISKCLKYLIEYGVDNAGGRIITLPGKDNSMGSAIALVLSHRFGVGGSYFRIGTDRPRMVDTVPFGCYRKEVFQKIGLFNEDLIRNQDIEFNLRLKRYGGKTLLAPDIVSYYYARSTLAELIRQSFSNGFWVLYSTKFAKMPFSRRHLVPLIFVLTLAASLFLSLFWNICIYLFVFVAAIYTMANLVFSFTLSYQKGLSLFPLTVVSFFALHLSYGFGSLIASASLVLKRIGI